MKPAKDPFEKLADDFERAYAEMTGLAPPSIMVREKDGKIDFGRRWGNMLREGEEAFVTMLRPPYDCEDDIEEISVSVQELVLYAHENYIDFHRFLKRRRWD